MVEPREGRVQTKRFTKSTRNTGEELEADLLRLAKEELGETSGGGQLIEKETWWWNQQVKEATKAKEDSFKKWQLSREEQDF